MKALKITLNIIAIFVIIVVIGSFFLPKNSRVERSITVGKSDSLTYNYVLDFSKFNEWNPWREMEPSSKTEIKGKIGEVGSSYSWDGKETGVGNFEVTKLEPYHHIYQKLTFIKPWEAVAANNFIFENKGDSTKVTWVYECENNGIIEKWMGLTMDKMIGKDYEKGLAKLKANLEK